MLTQSFSMVAAVIFFEVLKIYCVQTTGGGGVSPLDANRVQTKYNHCGLSRLRTVAL